MTHVHAHVVTTDADSKDFELSPVPSQKPHRVRSISPNGHSKRVTLRLANSSVIPLLVHRFAMVGERDRLLVREGLQRRVWVAGESGMADIPLMPIFEKHGSHALAGEKVDTRVAELSTADELHDFAILEAFHYRGIDFSEPTAQKFGVPKKGTGGRRAVLLLQLKLASRWVTAGYIELQMPLMMAKPRHEAFSRPFAHPTLKVAWKAWRKGGQALVNRIARIARVVVHPELRGAGLSAILVDAAVRFARERWHIGGQRALFVEISAEMLRHIDFVSGCGFHYLGDTEGNRARLAKDLGSVKQGAKGASGIMSLQRRYFALFESYRQVTGDSFESLRSRVAEVLTEDDPWKEMSLDEWLALRPVIRSPIPYFMIGLDEYSDCYVREAARPKRGSISANSRASGRPQEMHLRELELWSNYNVPLTAHNRMVMDCFGITSKTLKTRLAGPVTVTALAGTITFVGGSSGCGKSILLTRLDPNWSSKTAMSVGEIVPPYYTAGWLRPLPPYVPLFEYLASKYGAERTFHALARVGLSEAMLFLKPFEMLSRGQRYRAMLADLVLGDDDIWLIDEFCSDLDPLAARIVAHRLREMVREENRIAFVAAANHGHFISALRPGRVLTLTLGSGCVVTGWKEYAHDVLDQAI
jgi:uncharacterized protein